MKSSSLLLVLIGCVLLGGGGGGVLAGPPSLFPKTVSRSAAVLQGKAKDGSMDWASQENDVNQWAARGQQYGRNAADYGDAFSKDTGKSQKAASDHGSRNSGWDNAANAANRAASQASNTGHSATRWADGADADQDVKDQVWARDSQWNKGRRNNDDIRYAYDKSFDLKDSEDGGFQLAESSDSHAVDHLLDRAGSYDKAVDKDAAWGSGADAAKADRNSAWDQNAASGASSWDKYSRDSANADSGRGRDKDWANKVDRTKGGHRLSSDARKAASDVSKDLAASDGSYKRYNGYGKNLGLAGPYGYGLAGAPGYAPKPSPYSPYGGFNKGAEARKVWDHRSKAGLNQRDSSAHADNTKSAFNQHETLNDLDKGFGRHSQKAATDKKLSDWANQAAQTAHKADTSHGDSANAWNKDQGKAIFDENLWKKEAERKRLSDREQNKKVYKKWFNNKRRGGDNKERLLYDQDQANDVFGHDASNKKDRAQATTAKQWRSSADVDGHNAWAARQAAASNDAHADDWNKRAAGWDNANAGSRASDSAQKQGWNDKKWNDHQSRLGNDARAGKGRGWDRDVSTARSSAGATGGDDYHYYGAGPRPKAGLNLPGYPAYGYNAGHGFPNQGYGYNSGYGKPLNGYGKGYGYNTGYSTPFNGQGKGYGYKTDYGTPFKGYGKGYGYSSGYGNPFNGYGYKGVGSYQ